MSKLRVGVLMGGRSIEREVSFNSGRTVCDHLDDSRYDIIPLFLAHTGSLYRLPWQFLHRGTIADFESRLMQQESPMRWDDLKLYIDFMYIAAHGEFCEDGALQGMLELLRIPYLGSKVFASALCMDKVIAKSVLLSAGIAVPRSIIIDYHAISHTQLIKKKVEESGIPFPYIVKPAASGSSFGLSLCNSWDELYCAVEVAANISPYKKQQILIEEKIDGMEFSCVSLYDHAHADWIALAPTEVSYQSNTHFFDYEQKYMPGRAIENTPARCSQDAIEAIQKTCIAATKALGLRTLSRIDGFLKKDGTIVIVDPNSFSGMAPASFVFREAAHINMNHPQLINYLIKTELQTYGLISELQSMSTQSTIATQKKKIAVIMGGRSNEKEISLESGRNVTYKLSNDAYETIPLFLDSKLNLYTMDQTLLVRSSTIEIEELLESHAKILWSDLPNIADFVFIALHGGEGENGTVQGAIELLGMPYNGSSILQSALCMDKFKANTFLKSKGFCVPDSVLISKEQFSADFDAFKKAIEDAQIQFPLIIKPHDDGCSTFVTKAHNEQDMYAALVTLFNNGKSAALIEELITGMELTVGVLGNENPIALPPSQAIAQKSILSIQEKFLPGAGVNQTPAPLAQDTLENVKRVIADVYTTIGCSGYARIDCFYQSPEESKTGTERIVILEINSLPALTPATCIFHQAAEIGMSPRMFMSHIVTLGFAKHALMGSPKTMRELHSQLNP